MELTEKKIKLNDINLPALLGQNDYNLRFINNKYTVTVVVRGDNLIIRGASNEVDEVYKIFNELLYILKRKAFVSEEDVRATVELVSSSLPNIPGENNDRDSILYGYKTNVKPKTENQQTYCDLVERNDLVFAIGPAGTGKTFLAVAMAVAALKRNDVSRVILSRPAVEAGESLGFLPGDLKEKLDPYMRPLTDALFQMISPDKLKTFYESNIIEITPLAYMRGRTLSNSFIILDEAQNATNTQMKMFLTRIGFNSKVIVTGDITQIDLPNRTDCGLIQAYNYLQGTKNIGFISFSTKDVVRHSLVADIINAYKRHEDGAPDKFSKTKAEYND